MSNYPETRPQLARPELAAEAAQVGVVQPLAVDARTAAQMLSISERSLFDLVAPRGQIRVVRVGQRRLFPIFELERWLREQTEAASAEPASAIKKPR